MSKLFMRAIWSAAWLLCALILAAAADCRPDPPAISPNRIEAKAQAIAGHSELCSFQHPPAGISFTSFFAAEAPVSRFRYEPFIAVLRASSMRHAADTSPPVFV